LNKWTDFKNKVTSGNEKSSKLTFCRLVAGACLKYANKINNRVRNT